MAYKLNRAGEDRLARYFDEIGERLGRRGRRESFAMYAMGLLGEGERKSVEPIAARACGDPELCRAYTERLLNLVTESQSLHPTNRYYAAR